MMKQRTDRTIAAANGIATDKAFGAVTPPIVLSSNFVFSDFTQHPHFDYSRTANPTRELLADTLAKLEGGAGAIVTSSGMAAVNLLLDRLSPGDRVIAPHDCYGGTYRLLAAKRDLGQIRVDFVDQSGAVELTGALRAPAALVWIETPSNPLMRVVDIRSISVLAKKAGAAVVVDNTFLSPALQQPIRFGADYVVHSTTKYLNGHSDVIGGAVVAASAGDAESLNAWANTIGATGAPFDAYLTLRGIRTLFPRIERQQANAASIAEFLETQSEVSIVHYPGLRSHPGHQIAATQQAGFGAMLSFELKGGIDDVERFLGALKLFTLAGSLGGVESLIAYPETMTHAGMTAEALDAAGLKPGLLRLSVGIEAEEDLIADLSEAFAALG
jgi:cystathionine gamma-synthase